MQNRIKAFIRNYDVCKQNKVEQVVHVGLLQPLPIPVQIWEYIAMDFIQRLPPSHGKSTVLIIVDRLSKYAHFITISHPYTAVGIAHSFFVTYVNLK